MNILSRSKQTIAQEARQLRKQYTHQFYAHNMPLFIGALTTSLLLASFNLILSYLMQQIVDASMGSNSEPLIKVTVISVACLVGFAGIFSLDRIVAPRFLKRAIAQYKKYAFTEITRKNISTFSNENTSLYISALTNDVTSIEGNYLQKIFTLVLQIFLFFGALAMMLFYSPILTLAAMALSVIPMIATMICGNRLAEAEKVVSSKNSDFVSTIKDMLSGFTVIKSFKAEKEVRGLFEVSNEDLEEAKRQRRMTATLIDMLGSLAGVTAQMGVFLIGAYMSINGMGVTPGIVVIFLQLMNFIVSPIGSIPPILANRKAALELIDKLAGAIGQNVRNQGHSVNNVLDDSITVQNLRYGYEPGNPILNDISLKFESGKSYALVGASGSGKSTLLNLLMGASDDYEGQIKFDADERRDISSDSLYDLISIVQQNVFVFDSSIRDNITLFRDFPQDKVDAAIEKSGLRALIDARGENYRCGENGCGLSGGEKQRISIARCLLRETPVLLMDEATAALDAATAFAVTNSILDLNGITRIVVTHRLEDALMRKYDSIIVLKGGRICEAGSFDELMARREQFFSLYTVSKT